MRWNMSDGVAVADTGDRSRLGCFHGSQWFVKSPTLTLTNNRGYELVGYANIPGVWVWEPRPKILPSPVSAAEIQLELAVTRSQHRQPFHHHLARECLFPFTNPTPTEARRPGDGQRACERLCLEMRV